MNEGDYVIVVHGPGAGRAGTVVSPNYDGRYLVCVYGEPHSNGHRYAASDLLPVARQPSGQPDLAGLVYRLSAALAETRLRAETAEADAVALRRVLRWAIYAIEDVLEDAEIDDGIVSVSALTRLDELYDPVLRPIRPSVLDDTGHPGAALLTELHAARAVIQAVFDHADYVSGELAASLAAYEAVAPQDAPVSESRARFRVELAAGQAALRAVETWMRQTHECIVCRHNGTHAAGCAVAAWEAARKEQEGA